MKPLLFITGIFTIIILSFCSHQEGVPKINNHSKRTLITDETLAIVKGIALNRKGGAIVESNSKQYWIDGLDSWEDKYLNKIVIVKGNIENRSDNPVFLDTSDVKVQGIPVNTEEELKNMKSRTWIINAEITLEK